MLLASPHRPGCVSLCQTVVYSVYCIQVASVLGLPVAAMVPTQQSQTNANFYLCPAQPPARHSLSLQSLLSLQGSPDTFFILDRHCDTEL